MMKIMFVHCDVDGVKWPSWIFDERSTESFWSVKMTTDLFYNFIKFNQFMELRILIYSHFVKILKLSHNFLLSGL